MRVFDHSLSRRVHAAKTTLNRSWTSGLSGMLALAFLVTASGCGSSSLADPTPQLDVVAAMRRSDTAGGPGGAAGGGGTGWGTVKGRFTFNGTPPVMGGQVGFDPNKDVMCKVPVKDHSLLVDGGSKGIANILVFLVEASRINPEADGAPKEVVFDQKECRFLAPITALRVKDKLVVLNTDNTAHNTNSAPPRGNPPFNVLLEKLTGRFDYQFKNNLVMPTDATCSIHPWMKAYIIARPDPYFAVTAPDGTFEIAKLPAGEELEFQVWHEKAPAGLKALPQWSAKGRFKVTISKDGETFDLKDIAVEPSALGL
jgi:hypothetical protein